MQAANEQGLKESMVEGNMSSTHSAFASDVSIDGAKLAGCVIGDGE